MAAQKRGQFTLKTYNSNLYTWSPDRTLNKPFKSVILSNFYCDATPNSQGQDWITTYVYNLGVDANGIQMRLAYVACDYVE